MDLNYSNLNLFPTTIHCFDIREFDKIQNDLINDAYKLREIEPIGNIVSNVGGWQSDSFFVDSNKNSLQDVLLSVITNIPNIKRGTKTSSTAWININPSGAFNSKHNHPNSDFSGVLWIKCPKDSGNIIFENPMGYHMFNQINSYDEDFKDQINLHHCYWFPPIEGRVLIFPSHLEHEVEINKSNEDRISVSFNIRLSNEN